MPWWHIESIIQGDPISCGHYSVKYGMFKLRYMRCSD